LSEKKLLSIQIWYCYYYLVQRISKEEGPPDFSSFAGRAASAEVATTTRRLWEAVHVVAEERGVSSRVFEAFNQEARDMGEIQECQTDRETLSRIEEVYTEMGNVEDGEMSLALKQLRKAGFEGAPWDRYRGDHENEIPLPEAYFSGKISFREHLGKLLNDELWVSLVYRAGVTKLRIYREGEAQKTDLWSECVILLDDQERVTDIQISVVQHVVSARHLAGNFTQKPGERRKNGFPLNKYPSEV